MGYLDSPIPKKLRTTGQTLTLGAVADGEAFVRDGTTVVGEALGAGSTPLTNGGRLTLSSTDPCPSADQSAKTAVYLLPYLDDKIALYSGTAWVQRSLGSSGITLAVASFPSSGAASTVYDIFVYDNAGTPTLEAVAWSTSGAGTSTRATALARQDGVWCKNGALTRRYVGTVMTTAATQLEDSIGKRRVWNMDNRLDRRLFVSDSTDSWTYTTATYRQARAQAANQVDLVVGLDEDEINVTVDALVANSASPLVSSGVGINSTSANSADVRGQSGAAPALKCLARYRGRPGIGYHYVAWLERSAASGTTTWYGDVGDATATQSGLMGVVRA